MFVGVLGAEETAAEGDEVEEDRETLHRLCPTYAQDINSPLRHVRTRIYFTSESHMHSLINVLRYSHLCESCLTRWQFSEQDSCRASIPCTIIYQYSL